jgi:hypothetical protein
MADATATDARAPVRGHRRIAGVRASRPQLKPIAAFVAAALTATLATPAAAVRTDYYQFGIVDTIFNPAGAGEVAHYPTGAEAFAQVDPALAIDVTAAANAVYGTHYTRLEAVPVGPLDSFVFDFLVLAGPPPTVIQYFRPDWIMTPDPLGISGPYVLFNNGAFFGMGFAAINSWGIAVRFSGAAPNGFDFVGGDSHLEAPSFGGHWIRTAVPEPASWALMVTGFGLAGAALRRQRAISVGV